MKILEARSLGVTSLVLSIFALLVPAFGWVNLLASRKYAAGDVLEVCILIAFIAGIAAFLLAVAAGAMHRRSGKEQKPLRSARTAIWVLVAALILNLAAGALPGYFEAGTRSKVARAKAEMRNLAANLENYYVDHDCYPPAADLDGRIIAYEVEGATVSAGYVPWMLTTPTAYTTSVPWDPFHRRENGFEGPYRYATNGSSCWIMTSKGPDRDDDITIEQYPVPEIGGCKFRQFMSQFGGPAIEFDATNGTMSPGDIVRTGP